jgi:transposase
VRLPDSHAEPAVAADAGSGADARPRKARRDAATIRRLRIRAGAMFSQGMRQAEVAAALGEAPATVWRWHQTWSTRGMAGLAAPRRSGSRVPLTPAQLAAVDAALSAGPVANGFAAVTWSLERIAGVIEAVTGARCSRDTTRVVLREQLRWEPRSTWVKSSPPRALPTGCNPQTPGETDDHGGHAHTSVAAPHTRVAVPIRPDCPVACLAGVLSRRVFSRIREARPDPQTVGDVIALYLDQRLDRVPNLGLKGMAEIDAVLVGAGLLHAHTPHP